jgi:Flp pilus assembly protein TadD
VLEADAHNIVALLNSVTVLTALNRFDDAFALARQAVLLQPHNDKAVVSLAAALEVSKERCGF